MSEDNLINYQKSVYKTLPTTVSSDIDLFTSAHYKRLAAGFAFHHSLSSCCNETCCLILEHKLKEYTNFIDNRKGVNNFASIAKSLANNVTNVSKKWSSGLNKTHMNVSVNKIIDDVESSGQCENPSPHGCTVGQPTEKDLNNFFLTLSKIKERRKTKPLQQSQSGVQQVLYPPTQQHQSNSVQPINFQNEPKKKNSLYSTYEDDYLDKLKPKVQTDNFIQSKLSFKAPSRPPENHWKHNRDDISKRPIADDRTVNKHFTPGDRIKKLNKYLHEDEEQEEQKTLDLFKTASETLKIQNQKKYGGRQNQFSGYGNQCNGSGVVKKSLGGKGTRNASNRFVPPIRTSQDENSDMLITRSVLGRQGSSSGQSQQPEIEEDERLKHLDPKMVELIRSEIMDHGATITWDDIAGLEFAKHTIQEIVVWPMLRPDIFTGLRRPPKGILLFGPPGTGKTLIGKCIASQSQSTFFSISASSLTSKWIGDGEKMVRALFAVARVEQPSVVFIDEIDSLLSQRSDQEHESSRRIKTEFLVQLDGAATGEEDRLLIIGATNRPQELDEAARRRLVKRLYIPLPDTKARKQLVGNLMSKERNDLSEGDLEEIADLTEGYSGADMKNLCQEACLGPIRTISSSLIAHIDANQVRAVNLEDFKQALKRVRSSVSSKDLDLYIEWDKQFGMST